MPRRQVLEVQTCENEKASTFSIRREADPHIAGSAGEECRRMGRCMVEELQRYLACEPLKYGLTEKSVMRYRIGPSP